MHAFFPLRFEIRPFNTIQSYSVSCSEFENHLRLTLPSHSSVLPPQLALGDLTHESEAAERLRHDLRLANLRAEKMASDMAAAQAAKATAEAAAADAEAARSQAAAALEHQRQQLAHSMQVTDLSLA